MEYGIGPSRPLGVIGTARTCMFSYPKQLSNALMHEDLLGWYQNFLEIKITVSK